MTHSVFSKSVYSIVLVTLFLGSLALANNAFAQSPAERAEAERIKRQQDSMPIRPGQETSGQNSVGTTGVAPSVSLESPLKNIDSIEGLLVTILNIIIILMIPIIVFFIILAGFKYVTAQGNASQVEDATRALTYAIIGGVLILAAVAISQIIANVVDSF